MPLVSSWIIVICVPYWTPLFAKMTCLLIYFVSMCLFKCRRNSTMSRSHWSSLPSPSFLLPRVRLARLPATESLSPNAGKWNVFLLSCSCSLICLLLFFRWTTGPFNAHAVSTPGKTATFSHPALPLAGKIRLWFWSYFLMSTVTWMGRD